MRDYDGHALAYVYFEDDLGRRTVANLLTRDEARRIAANMAKLPGVVRRPQYFLNHDPLCQLPKGRRALSPQVR